MAPRPRKNRYEGKSVTDTRVLNDIASFFDFDPKELIAAAKEAAPKLQINNIQVQLEAEAVLLFVARRGDGFKKRPCKWCKQEFYHTYTNVAYCDEPCRAASLRAEGLIWNHAGHSDIERWGNRQPMVIGPYATIQLDEWLSHNPEQPMLPEELHPKAIVKTPDKLSNEEEVDQIMAEILGDDF